MQLTDAQKAGAAALAAALLIGVLQGVLSPGPEALQGHLRIGVAQAGDMKTWSTSHTTVAAEVAVLGLAPVDARVEMLRAYVCAPPQDGGVDPGASSVPGMTIVYDDSDVQPCVPGVDAQLEAWTQRATGAPWPCACAKGPACLWTMPLLDGGTVTVQAPLGIITLNPGTWSGVDCVPKACRVYGLDDGGDLSWPAACPTH